MNQFYKLLLPALLLPLFSTAQSNYKPGYIITNKGDTIRGFINIKEWDINPKKISFKTTVDKSEVQTLGVADITYFQANNFELYQKYAGPITDDQTSVAHIPNGRDTSMITDTVFLKAIQKGDKVTLFEYDNGKKIHFFIADAQAPPKELIYRIYHEDSKTINENGYMRQLYALAQKYNTNNDALKTSIEKADYNEIDLVAISRIINNITENEDNKSSGKKKGTFFFASVGLNASTISSDAAFTDFSSAKGGKSTPTSYFPRIAAGFNVLANPNTGRLVLRVEVAYTANKYKGIQSVSNYTERYSFDQNTFSLIPQLLYNFYNADALKIYAAAGASLNVSSYKGNKFIFDNKPEIKVLDGLQLSSTWTSFPLKIGAVITKKIDISAAYIPNAYFTHSDNFYVGVKAIQFGVSYLFN